MKSSVAKRLFFLINSCIGGPYWLLRQFHVSFYKGNFFTVREQFCFKLSSLKSISFALFRFVWSTDLIPSPAGSRFVTKAFGEQSATTTSTITRPASSAGCSDWTTPTPGSTTDRGIIEDQVTVLDLIELTFSTGLTLY